MDGGMNPFWKMLLGHEIFSCIILLATKPFLKELQSPLSPSYILNVRSLIGLQKGVTFSHNYIIIKIDSDYGFSLEKYVEFS